MQRLKDKVVVVTGAGRGIGRAEAMLLAGQGAKVVINDLGGGPTGTETSDASVAETAAREIRDAGGEAIGQSSNVATREGAEAAVQAAIDQFGRIDILINNAGIVRPARIDRMTDQDWHLCIDVSLTASFYTTRLAARHMIEQRSGVIVNTGSPAGFGTWGQASYAAAKEGLAGLTRVVARDLGEFGVRCNLIRPISHVTTTATPLMMEAIGTTQKLKQSMLWNMPMGEARMKALPEHVAALAVWLCTDAAAHVSGREFFIQGDEVALIPETEAIRTSFKPGGWTLDDFDREDHREYLFGDIVNRFVRPN